MAALVGIGAFLAYMVGITLVMKGSALLGLPEEAGHIVLGVCVLAMAWWVMTDAKRIGYQNYDSGLAMSPPRLAIAAFIASFVVLPWYLADRYRIQKKTLAKTSGTQGGLNLRD